MPLNNNLMEKLTAHKMTAISGDITVPGDKSISHRSIMFGALALGETTVTGLLEGEDVMSTAAAMSAMGADIYKDEQGTWHVHGVGPHGLQSPSDTLDMGNSGTSARLLMGIVAGQNISATFKGDASLEKRPMQRVMIPLREMGALISAREDNFLPLTIEGPEFITPITYRLPIASAQVKSCILLSGLNGRGSTTVVEPKPTRDHTENMLRAFGVNVATTQNKDGENVITVQGGQTMTACHIDVPADPSSAAFPTIAALLAPSGSLTIRNVLMNPSRSGVYECLKMMGAAIHFQNERENGGEPVADIVIEGGKPLQGITVPEDLVPSMIDEFPILSMAAACAQGTTYMSGLEELRVKESDRLLMVAKGLEACGVSLEMGEDSLTIHGNGQPPRGGALIETALDHRIAMSFLILGGASQEPITIDDWSPIKTSFPNFIDLMSSLGCHFTASQEAA